MRRGAVRVVPTRADNDQYPDPDDPRAATRQPGVVLANVQVRIEDTTPPRGQVVTSDGVTRPFVGWLALIRLLDAEAAGEATAPPAMDG